MPCPTCFHTIQRMTTKCEHNPGWFWCPRCGTLATQYCVFAADVPALVGRAVKLADEVLSHVGQNEAVIRLERAVRESCTGRPDP